MTLRIRNRKRPSASTAALAVAAVLLMLLPLVFVIVHALSAKLELWGELSRHLLPFLLWNTISLTVCVTLLSLALGVSLAWLVARTDLPGRKAWRWLLATPMVIPIYVGAFAYISLLTPGGLVPKWLSRLTGAPVYTFKYISVYHFWGVWIIMSIFMFPYVYMLVLAALNRMNVSLEEAARVGGYSPAHAFFRIILPMLRPSVASGALLVSLYVMSDFGAVGMLRYSTFTYAIFDQLNRGSDRSGAAVLSLVLTLMTLLVIGLEWGSRKRVRYFQTGASTKDVKLIPLGKWKPAALLYVIFIVFIAAALPLGMLVFWTVQALQTNMIGFKTLQYAWNSVSVSALSATAATLLAFPVAFLRTQYPSRSSELLSRLSYAGYALPGTVVALGIIFFFNRYVPVLYGTVALLVLAYVIRFLPQAMQSQEASLQQLAPSLNEASRVMGHTPLRTLAKVTLPLIAPGLVAGWSLVFVNSMKELPATLVLRPIGFETLAFRVWTEAQGYYFMEASPVALILVILSLISLKSLLGTKTMGG